MSNITYVIKTLRSNIINVIKEEHYEKTITNINPWIDSKKVWNKTYEKGNLAWYRMIWIK